ncbi:MAG: chorismate mutase [Kiritimatiellae bacterium]|nr:chorismate mutase [Kiritimatiellia bacterium]
MSERFRLDNVRVALVRLEEIIISRLIERAQFCQNPMVYEADALGAPLQGLSILGFLLQETERTHAKLRRYTSPDEHPFFSDLPDPVLPSLTYFDNPLEENEINVNAQVRWIYEQEIIPLICCPGDDRQYGSSAVNDVSCLQAISKRVHYGKFVAESKFRDDEAVYRECILSEDRDRLMALITDPDVENAVLQRVRHKARTYCSEISSASTEVLSPDTIVTIYSRWIIPMNKDVQVKYLMQRVSADQPVKDSE